MHLPLFAALASLAGCSTDTLGVEDADVHESPLDLDQPTDLGFTAQDVLDEVGARTYAASLFDGSTTSPDHDVSAQLVGAGPFAVSLPDPPDAVLRTVTSVEGTSTVVTIRGDVTITSADGSFDATGPIALTATSVDDEGIAWDVPTTLDGAVGAMPAWADDAAAASLAQFCPGVADPATVLALFPDGPVGHPWLTLELTVVEQGECNSTGILAEADLSLSAP